MDAKRCDICGEFYVIKTSLKDVEKPNYIQLFKQTVSGKNYIKAIELCPECAEKLYSFIMKGCVENEV